MKSKSNTINTSHNKLGDLSSNRAMEYLGLVFIFAVLLTCCAFNYIEFASYVSLLIFGLYIVMLVYRKPHFVIKYFAILFSAVISIIGCIACEFSNSYLSELDVVASFEGTLPLLVLCRWLLLQSIYHIDRYIDKRMRHVDEIDISTKYRWLPYLNILVLVVCLYLYSQVIMHPSFIYGYDRFEYSSEFLSSRVLTLANWIDFLIIIPVISWRQTRSKVGLLAMIVYIVYEIWVGNKFGSFLNFIWIVAIVYYDKILKIDAKVIRKGAVALACVVALLVGMAAFLQTNMYHKDPLDYLSTRTAQQGELWWRISSLYGGGHIDEISIELDALFDPKRSISESIGSHNGIYGMMYLAAPNDLVNYRLANGSRYTEAGYISAYYYFGALGSVVFAILMGFLISLFTNGLVHAMRCSSYFESAIWLRMLFVTQEVESMFLFSSYMTSMSIGCILLLIALSLSRVYQKRNRKENKIIVKSSAIVCNVKQKMKQ